MQHGAFGTLGVIASATFRLIPAEPFVHVEYERYRSMTEFLEAVRLRSEDDTVEFIDGLPTPPAENAALLARGD